MDTTILLVRHGQTDWNRGETDPAAQVRFRGRSDIPLSEQGQRQVVALAQRIAAEYTPAAICSSPLLRARQTAQAIADATAALIEPAPGLLDVDYGSWQGLTVAEAEARDPEAYRLWAAASDRAAAPGGEHLVDVQERAWAVLSAITASYRGGVAVAVSHDVICKLLIARALGLPLSDYPRVQQHTAALNLLICGEAGWSVASVNDLDHLQSIAC